MEHPLKISVSRIVSGGQTGADLAALDWAIANGVPHGGWCPRGRKNEDGPLHAKYLLKETQSPHYGERTRQNVIDSDGTLVVNMGPLNGGTLKTVQLAKKLEKRHLVLQLDYGVRDEEAQQLQDWLRRNSIATLNVAGPRESKRPGIYDRVLKLLELASSTFYYPLSEEKINTDIRPDLGTYTPPAPYLHLVRKR